MPLFLRIPALLAALAALSLAVVAGAGASRATYVEIKLGDQIRIAGTRVVCISAKDDTTGKPGIGCALFTGGAPTVGTYAPSLTAGGAITVERITKSGATTVFKRKLQGAGAAAKTYVLHSGDQFALPVGGDKAVGCNIQAVSGFIGPVCQYANKSSAVPGSYGFFVSGQQATVIQYNKSGNRGVPPALIKRYMQPR